MRECITLDDVYESILENPGLPVELNLDGNNTETMTGDIDIQGSYIGYINGSQDCKQISWGDKLKAFEGLEVDYQAFVRASDGKIYVVTSLDHIDFDENNLIELYCEPLA